MFTVHAGSMHEKVILGKTETYLEAFNLAWKETGNTVANYMPPNCYTWAYVEENGIKTVIHGNPPIKST